MRRWTPVVIVGVFLAGCSGEDPTKGDQVSPELPRVTVEVKGMS